MSLEHVTSEHLVLGERGFLDGEDLGIVEQHGVCILLQAELCVRRGCRGLGTRVARAHESERRETATERARCWQYKLYLQWSYLVKRVALIDFTIEVSLVTDVGVSCCCLLFE